LKAMSKAMAMDLSDRGIRVNAIGPGYIKTDMTKGSFGDQELRNARSDRMILDRWGEPEDVGDMATFLLSEKSSYITGQDFYVDGGWLAKGI